LRQWIDSPELTNQDLVSMQALFPTLWKLINDQELAAVPEAAKPALVAMEKLGAKLRNCVPDYRLQEDAVDDAHFFGPMFPNRLRKLAFYEADTERSTPDGCTKHTYSCRGLTEGLMVLTCPHGICIGFQILCRHEGPRVAFELIYTRFKEAPAYIVYDNVRFGWVVGGCTLCLSLGPVASHWALLSLTHSSTHLHPLTWSASCAGVLSPGVLHEARAWLFQVHAVPGGPPAFQEPQELYVRL
jgi:hypothetical protein